MSSYDEIVKSGDDSFLFGSIGDPYKEIMAAPEEEEEESSFWKAWNVTEKGNQYWLQKERREPLGAFARKLSTVPYVGPELTGIYGAAKGIGTALTNMIPGVRHFATEEHRRAFQELDTEEQRIAILLDTSEILLGGALTLAGPYLGKAAKKVGSAIKGPFRPKLPTDPEVIAAYKAPFSYEDSIRGVLKKRKLDEDEISAISDVLQGAKNERLKDPFFTKAEVGKAPSDVYKSVIEIDPVAGRKAGRVEFRLRKDIIESLDETILRAEHNKKHILESMRKMHKDGLIRSGEKPNLDWAEAAFQRQAQRFFGDDSIKVKLGEAPDELIAQFLADSAFPKTVTQIMSPGGLLWPSWFSPQRFVFGSGQSLYGTLDKVYKPFKTAKEALGHGVYDAKLKFSAVLKSEGLVDDIKITRDFRIKATPNEHFTKEVAEKGTKILHKLDELAESMLRTDDPAKLAELRAKHTAYLKQTVGDNPTPVGRFVRAHRRYMDWLYGDRMTWKVKDIFQEAGIGLTPTGKRALDKVMRDEALPIINKYFLSDNLYSYAENQQAIKQVLDIFKSKLHGYADYHPWFSARGKALNEGLSKLDEALTLAKPGSKKGYLGYLETYSPRIMKERIDSINNMVNSALSPLGVGKNFKPGYVKPRKKAIPGDLADFEEMFAARTNAHYKEKLLYPAIKQIVENTKTLPRSWRGTIAHYLGRGIGQSTWVDQFFADAINKTWGRLPGTAERTSDDIVRYGQILANMAYAAGLGFRPFSAIRNMLQPLINVPADLGGLRSWEHLARGYTDVFRPKVMKELRAAKIFTESIPDIAAQTRALPFAKKSIRVGKRKYIPYGLRDITQSSLWLFKRADYFNRAVTGAAALRKWNSAKELIHKGDDLKSFTRKAGLHGRNPWVRDEILNDLRLAKQEPSLILRESRLKEARNKFLRDVVGDTQYLYGNIESPIAIGYGGTGRTFGLFQSWWMNYGAQLTKWLRTGDASLKSSRVFNFLTSTAIAGEILARYWGTERAASTVAFGPFPLTQVPVPPSVHLIESALKTTAQAGRFLAMMPSKSGQKRAKALLEKPLPTIGRFIGDEISVFLPGGLLLRKTIRELQERRDPELFRILFEMLPERKARKQLTPLRFLQETLD